MKKSFSLLEVLIFVSIMGLFFVLAAAVLIASVRDMKINERKILATRYAEELTEWLRSEKEANWGGSQCSTPCSSPSNFTERATVCGTSCIFCFKDEPVTGTWPSAGNCGSGDYLGNTIFKRNVTLTSDVNPASGYVNSVKAEITVSWTELGNSYSVTSKTIFTVWE